jgi:hypothetical protein
VTLMIYLTWDEAVRAEEFAETLLDLLIWRLPLRSGFRAHEVADAESSTSTLSKNGSIFRMATATAPGTHASIRKR